MKLPLQDNQSINQKLTEIQHTLEVLADAISEKSQDEKQLIKIKEVSNIIGFNPDWIYKRIATNTFPNPIKIGRSSRWRKKMIYEWLDKNCH